jgi:hypothetical protein
MAKKTPLYALLLFCFVCPSLSAQDTNAPEIVSDWYKENPRATPYIPIRKDITALIIAARKADIPAAFLLDVLNEAAARNIPASQALQTLHEKLDMLVRLKKTLDEHAACLAKNPAAKESIASSSLLNDFFFIQRRGIPYGVIESVLSQACAEKKDFAAALSALRTLANIPSLNELTEEKMTALTHALVKSTLSPAGYSALSSFYIKGKLRNLAAPEITEIIISTLRKGKGLIRIEQELDRRRRP